ncbi:PAS domain S-box protein, partial [Dyadobacter sp.]|uniref:PAS domain S-box protein n=1 Tax=Dyadobacter sp. TaxID=1914288 RepID=UPI003F6E929C
MKRMLSVVLLENSGKQEDIVKQLLSKAQLHAEIQVVATYEEFVNVITKSPPDIILSEYKLPDIDCSQALKILREHGVMVPFIVVSDAVSDDMAGELLSMGVEDYIAWSQVGRLPFAIHKALEAYGVKREQQALLQQLSNREKQFRTLIEHSTDAVVILNKDAQPTYVSLAVKNVLGYTAEEVMNMDIFTKAHPDDLTGLYETMAKVSANPGKAMPGHTGRMLHKDGTWRWIEATVTNLLHEPAINGIVDNFRDVTKQKVSEENLLHLNRLYAFLSQVNHTLVHAPDAQTVFTEVCRIACETGKFEAAWIGMFADDNSVNVLEQQDMSAGCLTGFTSATEEQHLLRTMLDSRPY